MDPAHGNEDDVGGIFGFGSFSKMSLPSFRSAGYQHPTDFGALRIGVRPRPIISMMVGSDTIEPGARMGYFAYTVVRETFEMRVPGSDADARAGLEGRAGT